MTMGFVSIGDGISWGDQWGFADELAKRLPIDPNKTNPKLDLSTFQNNPFALLPHTPTLLRILQPNLNSAPAAELQASQELDGFLTDADLVVLSLQGHDAVATYMATCGKNVDVVVRGFEFPSTTTPPNLPPPPTDPVKPYYTDPFSTSAPRLAYWDWRATIEKAGESKWAHVDELRETRTEFRAALRTIVKVLKLKTNGTIVLLDMPDPISLWPQNRAHPTWTNHFYYLGQIIATVAKDEGVRHAPIRQEFLDRGLNVAEYVSIDGLHVLPRGQDLIADQVIETLFD